MRGLHIAKRFVYVDEIPDEKSNEWIGAWWLGYLVISTWVVLAAFPLYFFPKTMRTKSSTLTSQKSRETKICDNLGSKEYEKVKFISSGNTTLPNDDKFQSNTDTIRSDLKSTNCDVVDSHAHLSFCAGLFR